MTRIPHQRREIVEARDPEDLANRAADWIVTQLGGAGHERLAVCLSGGSTPKRLYHRLAIDPWRAALPWDRLNWFWGDERFVPHDDPRSNFAMTKEALLAKVPCPAGAIHKIPVDGGSAAISARLYEFDLQRFYGSSSIDGSRPLFDVMLLGIGSDGHTASLFPGMPAIDEGRKWVVASQPGLDPFVPRITLTLPAIAASRAVVFLVAGADKRDVLSRILAGEDLPAARVAAAVPTLWFVDQAALGG